MCAAVREGLRYLRGQPCETRTLLDEDTVFLCVDPLVTKPAASFSVATALPSPISASVLYDTVVSTPEASSHESRCENRFIDTLFKEKTPKKTPRKVPCTGSVPTVSMQKVLYDRIVGGDILEPADVAGWHAPCVDGQQAPGAMRSKQSTSRMQNSPPFHAVCG